VSWTWFLKQQSREREQRKAASSIPNFLGLRLPKDPNIQFSLDVPGGTSIDPFPLGDGRVLEVNQTVELMNLLMALCMADEISESANWIRVGEARASGEEGTETILMYRTPDGTLGFEHEGKRYRTRFNAEALLKFIRTTQEASPTSIAPTIAAPAPGKSEN
jgi:hypothetical protein